MHYPDRLRVLVLVKISIMAQTKMDGWADAKHKKAEVLYHGMLNIRLIMHIVLIEVIRVI